MTATTLFEALVWGAYLVGLVAVAHMMKGVLAWLLMHTPGAERKYERERMRWG